MGSVKNISVLFAALLSMTVACAVAQSAPDPTKAKVVELLGKKEFSAACALLDSNYPGDMMDPTVLFLRARCRVGMRDYSSAIEYYERILTLSPDSVRTQQELAKARQLLEEQERDWFARLEAGFIYDTNINSGPQSDQILVDGTPIIILGAGADQIDAVGYTTLASGGYIHTINNKLSLLVRGSAEHTDYFHGGEYGLDSLSASAGATFMYAGMRFLLLPGLSWESFGGETYKTSTDMMARATKKINNDATASFTLSLTNNDYRTVTGRDGISYTLSPNLSYKFQNRTSGSVGLIARYQNAQSNEYSNDSAGFRLGLEHAFTAMIKGTAGYQFLNREYDSPDLLFSTEPRKDEQHVVSLGASIDISRYTSPGSAVNFKYQFVHNDSSLPIYEFKRETTTLSFSKAW